MHIMQSRRDFLTALSAAGTAGVLGARGPPEVTTIRLSHDANIHQLSVLTWEAGQ